MRANVTPSEYYRYRLMTRPNQESLIHYGGRLFQQYVVDQYAKIENQRLTYLRLNQKKLRAELYQGLVDAVNPNGELRHIGRRVVLPSSFAGGPRNMTMLTKTLWQLCEIMESLIYL